MKKIKKFLLRILIGCCITVPFGFLIQTKCSVNIIYRIIMDLIFGYLFSYLFIPPNNDI